MYFGQTLSESQVAKNEKHYYYNADDIENIVHNFLRSAARINTLDGAATDVPVMLLQILPSELFN